MSQNLSDKLAQSEQKLDRSDERVRRDEGISGMLRGFAPFAEILPAQGRASAAPMMAM